MEFHPETSSDPTTADHRRREMVRRMGRERLLRYTSGIIQIQTTPLRDIIRDYALPYLPAQSLLRFRSVSSTWNHLISSPFFAHTQSHTQRSLSGLFFHPTTTIRHLTYLPLDPKSDSIPDPSLSFLPDTVSIVASSNGLIACRSVVNSKGPPRYYVCNPATAEWTALPKPLHHINGAIALIFDPSPLNFSADYHLVCALSHLFGLEVFSSRSGKWRTSNVVLPEAAEAVRWSSVTTGGVAYWRTKRGSVVSYHPTVDKFCIIAPPPSMERIRRWQLGEMDGKLCCVGAGEGIVEVYLLDKGGSNWRKMGAAEVTGDPWPLVFEGRKDRVVVWVDGRVVGIDVRSGEATVMAEGLPQRCREGVPYISSLVVVREFCFGRGCFTCKLHSEKSSSDSVDFSYDAMFSGFSDEL